MKIAAVEAHVCNARMRNWVIVCVRTDRAENVDLHRRVWESVRAAT